MIFALFRTAFVLVSVAQGFLGRPWWWAFSNGGFFALGGVGYMLYMAARTTAVFRERINPDKKGLIIPAEWPALLAKDLILGLFVCNVAFWLGRLADRVF